MSCVCVQLYFSENVLHYCGQRIDSKDQFTQSLTQEMKTISIDEYTHKELKSLCKSYKKSIVEFTRHGVMYFKKTGIDPERSSTESPQKAIQELSKRVEQIIAVIKVQEQDKMNPLLEQLMLIVRRLELMLNDAPKETSFKTILNRTEEMMEADQKNHVEQLKTQHKYYKDQLDQLQKNYEQTNGDTIKKLDEVMGRLDKMTAILNGLHTK